MLCWQEALGGRADSPPTESWRKAVGLQSPSSGTEVIYGSPEEEGEEEGEEEQEWYEESLNRQNRSLSRPPPRSALTTNSKGTLMNALLTVTGCPDRKGRP